MDEQYDKGFQKALLAVKYFLRVISLLSEAGKFYIVMVILFALIFSVTPSITVLIMQEIINTVQISANNLNYLIKLLFFYIAIDIISGIASLSSGYFENKFQMKASLIINMSILEKVKEFSLKDFEDSETYDLLQRAMKVGFTRMFAFFKSFVLLFQSFTNVILFSLILFSWKWWIIPFILIIPLVNTVITAHFGKKQFLISKNRADKERKLWYYQYLLTRDIAFKEIKIFNLGGYIRERYKKLSIDFINQDKKLLNQRTLVQILLFVLEQAINSLLFMYIILRTFVGEILIGELITYTRSISNVKSSAQGFLSHINSIYENILYISQYFEFIDKKYTPDFLLIEEMGDQNMTASTPSIPYIEIKNLYYRYKGQDNYAINNLSLKIERNSLIAFIGMNGSGKTTLVKILATLYQDYQGQIFFGKNELRSLNPNYIRSKIGILFQDFVKYELSVRENIAFGHLDKMENSLDILQVINKTGLENRISDLDMQLGFWFDEGVQLSGGEWLKIALGRAFIRDAELYLLDEPNAALDAISEKVILKSFKELVEGKIGIIISHRIASIKNIVDKIIVFNDGSIEAIGSHEELLKSSNIYKEMYHNETAENKS